MTRTRSNPARSRQSVRKSPVPATPPLAAFLAGAEGSMTGAFAAVQAAMNTATGTMLTQLLLVQGKTLEQAAAETGVPVVKLRAEGIEFVMRLVRVIDNQLGYIADCPPEMLADAVAELVNARAAGNA